MLWHQVDEATSPTPQRRQTLDALYMKVFGGSIFNLDRGRGRGAGIARVVAAELVDLLLDDEDDEHLALGGGGDEEVGGVLVLRKWFRV